MEESLVEGKQPFMADEEAAIVAQVSEGALDLPAFAVAAQRASVLQLNFAAPAMWTDQLNTSGGELLAQPLRVVSPVTDEARRAVAWPAPPSSRHAHALEGFWREADFRGRGAKESTSQRYTRAVCHHHPLCTLATFGFTHAEPPFLALAKLPSRKTSSQLSLPSASSCPSKARQILNQSSRASHSCSRRQQVLAEGYSRGRSRQRAPLRRTHKMPSKTIRSSALGRPRALRRALGKSGRMISHCRSLSKDGSRIPSVPHHPLQSYKHKM